MHGNGADAYAALVARVAELEAAVRILARCQEEQYTPRLLDLEREQDRQAARIAELADK